MAQEIAIMIFLAVLTFLVSTLFFFVIRFTIAIFRCNLHVYKGQFEGYSTGSKIDNIDLLVNGEIKSYPFPKGIFKLQKGDVVEKTRESWDILINGKLENFTKAIAIYEFIGSLKISLIMCPIAFIALFSKNTIIRY